MSVVGRCRARARDVVNANVRIGNVAGNLVVQASGTSETSLPLVRHLIQGWLAW